MKMGNLCFRKNNEDPDSAWRQQNKEMARNPIYKFVNFSGGGRLIDAYKNGGVFAVEKIIKTEVVDYLYNNGQGKMLTTLDHIKWQRRCIAKRQGSTVFETKSDADLQAEYQEDEFNKLYDHEVCWDMDNRGGVGETPFHLLYLVSTPIHLEVAKILMKHFPKMALDRYEGEEYYGESALHIAIIFGSVEAVKVLIENGANINERASGRFFLPEDQKKGRTKDTDYEGYAYYGEYPLSFATCIGNQEIYDYLINNGADPNLQDSFGNTCLHMAVIHDQVEMYKYLVKHHKKPAKTDIRNKANLTPLTLASKLGRQKIFKEMLELNSLELWRYSNITCSVYPLHSIDSIGPTGDSNFNSALMIIINGETDEHLEMLEGGVMRQLLDEKWKTFARKRFFIRLVLAFLHLALISTSVYTRPPEDDLLAIHSSSDIIRFVAEILTVLGCIVTLVVDCFEIGAQGFWSFVNNCRHAPALTLYLLSCVLLLACIPFRFLRLRYVEDILLIVATPTAWSFLLFFARGYPGTGAMVVMMYLMLRTDFLKFSIIFAIFIAQFSGAFYFLFQGSTDNQSQGFLTIGDTIMTLFQMTLGEFKYQDFNYTKYPGLTKVVFAVFMILVPILLLNMLIAMMGNTYTQVINKSEKEWRKQWAKIVVVLERSFTRKQLLKFQQEYSIKLTNTEDCDLGEGKGKVSETRGLMVIKTSNKTKASQRKGAISAWKRVGKEVVRQMKVQRAKGSIGPIILKPAPKRSHDDGDSSDDDNNQSFAAAIQQLAWTKDIDLTKGKALVTDANVIEKSGQTDKENNVKSNGAAIPNGKPRTFQKFVKKPPGTPKSSPKPSLRTLTVNKISPLYEVKSTDESSNSDMDTKKKSTNIEDDLSKSTDLDVTKSTAREDKVILVKSDSDKEDKDASGSDHSDLFSVGEGPKKSWIVPKLETEEEIASHDSDSKGAASPAKSPKKSPKKSKKHHKRHGSPGKKKDPPRSSSTTSLLQLAEYSSKESEG
ncbi:transient receptor potential cation channel subfamily V member 5-like isoform X2 [Mytilus trossulus]|uniref:transient receptor potential cation channel subfamily V member 5-like isoform X2 n=1 Tax=Mytilus trossulus TaxID=6551 RepID=UPI003007B143